MTVKERTDLIKELKEILIFLRFSRKSDLKTITKNKLEKLILGI